MRKIPIWIPILICGLLIRIYLLIRIPIWLDENITMKLLLHPLSQIISGNFDPTHPSGYYIFLKLWSFVSINTVWLRLSTIMFFLFNFFLLYQIGIRFYDKKLGQNKNSYKLHKLFCLCDNLESSFYKSSAGRAARN